MKKLLILVAVLLLAAPAFSQASRFAGAAGAGTTLNDDSCDIGVTPAATLLLPYFEVSMNPDRNEALNTIFTITNVSADPQIAHITVWTDWSVPVLDFNIFLTGYDVQGLNLWDILVNGDQPTGGIPVTSATTPRGSFSDAANPAFRATATANCTNLPGRIPAGLLAEVQDALTGGSYDFSTPASPATGCVVGGVHENFVGYITVDVARDCTTTLPTSALYYGANGDIAYENVLIGDYQRIDPRADLSPFAGAAGGETMVHIRAIPEGTVDGTGAFAFGSADVTFPYTFYRRYQDPLEPLGDRRQPLPALFAARYIEAGVGSFNTDMVIWREGVTTGAPTCTNAPANSDIPLEEIVRFDEHENPSVGEACRISPCQGAGTFSFPETGAFDTQDLDYFPQDVTATADLGGWMYMNLNHSQLDVFSGGTSGSQNWVTVRMTAEQRYAVDFNAAWLSNGCAIDPGVSEIGGGTYEIGPYDNNPFDEDPI